MMPVLQRCRDLLATALRWRRRAKSPRAVARQRLASVIGETQRERATARESRPTWPGAPGWRDEPRYEPVARPVEPPAVPPDAPWWDRLLERMAEEAREAEERERQQAPEWDR